MFLVANLSFYSFSPWFPLVPIFQCFHFCSLINNHLYGFWWTKKSMYWFFLFWVVIDIHMLCFFQGHIWIFYAILHDERKIMPIKKGIHLSHIFFHKHAHSRVQPNYSWSFYSLLLPHAIVDSLSKSNAISILFFAHKSHSFHHLCVNYFYHIPTIHRGFNLFSNIEISLWYNAIVFKTIKLNHRQFENLNEYLCIHHNFVSTYLSHLFT